MRLANNVKRLLLAWMSAVIAAALCVWQGSVHVDGNHPSTMFNLLQHKSGILLVVCAGWLWCEAVLMVLSPASFRHTIRLPKERWERRRWVRDF